MKYENWLFGKDGALFRAAAIGDLAIAQDLQAEGADINVRSPNGYTPLHRAAQNGHLDVAEFLLTTGADPLAEANDGSTPLSLARDSGQTNTADMLAARLDRPDP